MLPADMVTQDKLKEIEEQNRRLFSSLKEAANSDEPIWKINMKQLTDSKKD